MAGDVVADRYELQEVVGSGGMSSVYRAHDRVLERTVALKVLHDRLVAQKDVVERFSREAKLVAGLSHHNIVAVIDRGEYDGSPFIVLEYISGENLKQLLDARRPAPGRAGARAHDRDRERPRVRAPEGLRPSRRQASERAPERQGRGEGHRLRDRAAARGARGRDPDRHGARHLRLHLARAGPGAARRRAHRHLLARDRPLRAAHGRGAVHRRELRRGRDAAHQRAAAAGHARAARGAAPRRGGDRQGAREGPGRPVRDDGRVPRASSRRASPSSARARTPARPACSRSSSPTASSPPRPRRPAQAPAGADRGSR